MLPMMKVHESSGLKMIPFQWTVRCTTTGSGNSWEEETQIPDVH